MNNPDPTEPYRAMYIWDSMEKRGFPISEHIKTVDLDDLSREERLVIAAGVDVNAIELIISEHGTELLEAMAQNLALFISMLFKIYVNESDEKKQEIISIIRSAWHEND